MNVLESIYAISKVFTSIGLNEYCSFYIQMSWLDSFCIGHFDERDDFICVTEKDLLLDKVDFSKKGLTSESSPATPRRHPHLVVRENRKLMNSSTYLMMNGKM